MSVYDEITQAIIAELEKGVPPWVKSWSSHLPMNVVSQKEYRGINILLPWKASQGKFTSPYWLTYRQAESLGGYVRQGEKATSIVYAASGRKVVVGPDEQTEEEYFFTGIGAKVERGGSRAFYRPSIDEIRIPDPRDFKSMVDYYATALHEHVHWSGHSSRLHRPLVNRFGTEEYAQEELVAELGAAFLCSHLSIPSRLREDHAAYINGWIRILEEDKRAIFKAASHATKAADYLREKADEFGLQEAI